MKERECLRRLLLIANEAKERNAFEPGSGRTEGLDGIIEVDEQTKPGAEQAVYIGIPMEHGNKAMLHGYCGAVGAVPLCCKLHMVPAS